MARILLLLFLVFFTISGEAQDENLYFSEALDMYLPKYASNAEKAYRNGNVERAAFLFDSLVNNCLNGSYLDNFKVKNLDGKLVPLEKLEKPLYLITNASWIVSSEGEIPAFNKLATEYHDKIDFVVLFWDSQKAAKEMAKKYHKTVKVFYVDESGNESNFVIRKLKHSLGVPTSFLVDENKKIVDIKRKVSHPYGLNSEASYDLNKKAFSEGISQLLLNDTIGLSEHSPARLP